MEYEPVCGSFSALKLSRDMPNFPSTVFPSSFSLSAPNKVGSELCLQVLTIGDTHAFELLELVCTQQIWQ